MTAFTAVIARPFICLSIAHGCTRADLLWSALFLCTLPLFSTGRLLICYTGTIIQRRRIRHEAQQYPSAVQLEERYGSRTLLSGIPMTALVSDILQCVLFPSSALLGASDIVFMLIMLSSLAGSWNGGIPITLILVGALYLSQQVYDILFVQDNVANFMHIVGGACGTVFGFAVRGK